MSSKRTRSLRYKQIRRKVQGLSRVERQEQFKRQLERISKSPLQSTATLPDPEAECTCYNISPRCLRCFPITDQLAFEERLNNPWGQEPSDVTRFIELFGGRSRPLLVGTSNLGPSDTRFAERYSGGTRTGRWNSRSVPTSHPETQTINYAMEGLRQAFADLLEPLRGFAETVLDAVNVSNRFASGGFVPPQERTNPATIDFGEVERRVMSNETFQREFMNEYTIGIDMARNDADETYISQIQNQMADLMRQQIDNEIIYGSSIDRLTSAARQSSLTAEDLEVLRAHLSGAEPEPIEEEELVSVVPTQPTIDDDTAEMLARIMMQRMMRTQPDNFFGFAVDRNMHEMSYRIRITADIHEMEIERAAFNHAGGQTTLQSIIEVINSYEKDKLNDHALLGLLVRYMKNSEQWSTLERNDPTLFNAIEARISQGHHLPMSAKVRTTVQDALDIGKGNVIKTGRRRLTLRKGTSEPRPDTGEGEGSETDGT